MAIITSAGTYGPSSFALRSGMSVSSRLGRSETALTEASGAMDRAEISREAAKMVADSRPSQLVQVLSSATGRTEARVSTMKEMAPPSDAGAASSQFKGTRALVDSRATAAARMRNIDLTVGGPNSAGALKGAPIFKLPEPKPEQTQIGQAKITQAQAEERAKAIAEAKIAARSAVQRLQTTGGLGGAQGLGAADAGRPMGGIGKGTGYGEPAALRRTETAETADKAQAVPEKRESRREDKTETARRAPSPAAGAAPTPGSTLNFLA